MNPETWEQPRVAGRPTSPQAPAFRPRPDGLEDFAALECPREHRGWLTRGVYPHGPVRAERSVRRRRRGRFGELFGF